jgi:apolipoprotein D and lipocalin family protein
MKTKNVVGITLLGLVTLILLKSCKTIPKNAIVVKPFDVEKYLGKWYEIARFDFRFEKNLKNTTANYSLNEDGSIKVVNRGYNYKYGKWEEATGKAKFVSSTNEAKLKVSFFKPFYSGYNVIAIDANYN